MPDLPRTALTLLACTTLTLSTAFAQNASKGAVSAPLQEHRVQTGTMPVYDVQTAATWTKPQLPPAPAPKLPTQKAERSLPVGPPSWNVVSPETPAVPEAAGPTAGTITTHARPLASWSGQSRSLVSEPSAAWFGNTCLYTHNWDAAVGIAAGGTGNPIWTRRDPRNLARVDNGFCCDQIAHKCDGPNELLAWYVQYRASTTRGSCRIVIYTSEANLIAGTSHSYVFNPQNFGWPTGYWLDYPSITSTSQYMYCTSNVFRLGSASRTREGVVCWRLNLSDMKARRTVRFGWSKLENRNFCWRLAQNGTGGTTAYWWHPRTTTSGTVYRWPDSGSVTSRAITVGSFRGQLGRPGPYNWTGAGTTNVLGRIDWRATGGWVGRDTVNFMWTCATTTGRTAPYVRVLRLNQSNITRNSEFDIWNSNVMFAYPSAAANRRGDAGGTITYCSRTGRPTTAVWMMDDQSTTAPIDLSIPYAGANSPNASSWGDYMTCQPHPSRRNSFLATGMVLDNGGSGNANQRPFYAYFGRARDFNTRPDLEVLNFTTSQTTLTPGARVTLGATFRNVGNSSAPSSTGSFRLSTNNIISTGDTLLAALTVSLERPGFGTRYTRTVTVPARNTAAANCWLGVLADERAAITESSEANNSASIQVRCLRSRPDLTVEALTASTTLIAGGSGSANWRVRNIGRGSSLSTTNVALYLSTNTTISTADTLLRVDTVSGLLPNATATRTVSFSVPYCYTATTAYVGAVVDQAGLISEDLETNNSRATTSIRVTPFTGNGRYLEWRSRWNGAARSPNGTANLRLVNGPRTAGMCVRAPRNVGDWHLCHWAATPSYGVDALTNLSLGLINGPLLQGHLARIPSSGVSAPRISLPQQSGVRPFTVYVHSVWFSGDFMTFKGLGTNAIRMTIGS